MKDESEKLEDNAFQSWTRNEIAQLWRTFSQAGIKKATKPLRLGITDALRRHQLVARFTKPDGRVLPPIFDKYTSEDELFVEQWDFEALIRKDIAHVQGSCTLSDDRLLHEQDCWFTRSTKNVPGKIEEGDSLRIQLNEQCTEDVLVTKLEAAKKKISFAIEKPFPFVKPSILGSGYFETRKRPFVFKDGSSTVKWMRDGHKEDSAIVVDGTLSNGHLGNMDLLDGDGIAHSVWCSELYQSSSKPGRYVLRPLRLESDVLKAYQLERSRSMR